MRVQKSLIIVFLDHLITIFFNPSLIFKLIRHLLNYFTFWVSIQHNWEVIRFLVILKHCLYFRI